MKTEKHRRERKTIAAISKKQGRGGRKEKRKKIACPLLKFGGKPHLVSAKLGMLKRDATKGSQYAKGG